MHTSQTVYKYIVVLFKNWMAINFREIGWVAYFFDIILRSILKLLSSFTICIVDGGGGAAVFIVP